MTITVKSQSSQAYYFVEIDENNQGTDCGCKDHEFRPGRRGGCKHMREVTEQVARALAFADLKARYDVRGQVAVEARRAAYWQYEMMIGAA